MALRTITSPELRAMPLCDACVNSISWENDGRDLCLTMSLPDDRLATFFFRWTEKLRIDLTTEGTNGTPMTWEVTFDDSQKGTIQVLFDFASQGSIQLQCETIDVDGI